jgi:hypothetical protein
MSEIETAEMDFPARMLLAAEVAASENTRYAFASVRMESHDGKACAVATDGRRLAVVEWTKSAAPAGLEFYIPEAIALKAAKMAKRAAGDGEPMVKVIRTGNARALRLFAGYAGVEIQWTEEEGDTRNFPPYRECIPQWSQSAGVGMCGATSDLAAEALDVCRAIVKCDGVKMFIPTTPVMPMGFEATDEDGMTVLVVLMARKMDNRPQTIRGHRPAKSPEATTEAAG